MSDDIVTRLRRVKSTQYSHIAGESFVNFTLMVPYGASRNISALANVIAGCVMIHAEAADEIERLRAELAARCGDHGPGAHTAGPVEHFIPEAL